MHERSIPCLPPRPGKPNRSCWWHHPASRSDRAAELMHATQIGCRPDAVSSLNMACAAVGAAARRAFHQPRRMQLWFAPGVAPSKPMLLANVLVEMLHVPAHVMRPVL